MAGKTFEAGAVLMSDRYDDDHPDALPAFWQDAEGKDRTPKFNFNRFARSWKN
jgi:hypothetical protein